MQTVFKERRVDELRRLVLHQLELTNSIEHYCAVKDLNTKKHVPMPLVSIRYFFVRGLQEKAGGSGRVNPLSEQHEVSTTCVSGWDKIARACGMIPTPLSDI